MSPLTLVALCYGIIIMFILVMLIGISRIAKKRGPSSFKLGSSSNSISKIIGEKWLCDHLAELPEMQWSAASKDGLITSKPSLTALMKELRLKRIGLTEVAIKFKEAS